MEYGILLCFISLFLKLEVITFTRWVFQEKFIIILIPGYYGIHYGSKQEEQ